MWVCHLVGIFESVFVINTRVMYTRGHRPICTPTPEFPWSYLSFFLIFKVYSPSRIADAALLAKCVKGRGRFYSVCMFAHTLESTRAPQGAHLDFLYFSVCTFHAPLENYWARTEHRETRHRHHGTGAAPNPQQILSKHPFPSLSPTPTPIKAVFQMVQIMQFPNSQFQCALGVRGAAVCVALLWERGA